MGRGMGIKWFLISVLSLAIIVVLCIIFSKSDKREVATKEEIVKEEQQTIDLENFAVDEDNGFYVIEALIVPKEWRSDI